MSTCASTRPIVAVASSRTALMVSIAPSRVLGEAGELLGLVLRHQRAGDLVQVAGHHLVDLVEREVDAMVGHAALREVVGADAVAAVAGAHEALAGRRFLGLLLAHLLVLDARGEHAPGLLA